MATSRTTTHSASTASAAATHAAAAHPAAPKNRYIEAIGRRKTAIARVRLTKGDGKFIVNGKAAKEYFMLPRLIINALRPLAELKIEGYDVSAQVKGGGIHAQAEAIRLGIARAVA